MAWRLLTECYDRVFDGMTDSEWRVFCVICRHANDEAGDDCFPSTAVLAQKSRLHKSTVPHQIQGLESKGWIKTKQEPGKKRFFFVNVDRVLSCPFIGGEEPIPLCDSRPRYESEPLRDSIPLCDTRGEWSDKSEGRGLTSQTRREHIKEQLKEQDSFSSLALSDELSADLFAEENSGLNYADHTPAPGAVENGINPLISNGNTVAAAMGRNPADDDCKNADNPLNQKENGDADTPVRTKETKADPIPYAKIVALYNEKCVPPLPRAMNPSEQLKKNIRARCKDLKTIKGVKTVGELLEEFGKLFDMVAQSDWLCGRNGGWGKCNFPWLMQREKFENTINGLYSNRSARSELPDHLNPRIRFDKAYYEQEDPFNPDGSLNWKRKPTK